MMQELSQTSPDKKNLSGSALKWIAMVLMVADHIGAFVIWPYLAVQQVPSMWFTSFYYLLRTVGRLAFPLFCFLLVEGFFHTHNRKKYLLQLSVFAVLSDPSFDFANGLGWFDFSMQNVFCTLALGLLAIWCMDFFTAQNKPIFAWGGVILCGAAAHLCNTDYSFLGVALILAFYLCRGKKSLYYAVPVVLYLSDLLSYYIYYHEYFIEFSAPVLLSLLVSPLQETCGALSLIFISRYNGQRGGKMPKYFFYAFYPAHILLLAGIRFLLLGK